MREICGTNEEIRVSMRKICCTNEGDKGLNEGDLWLK